MVTVNRTPSHRVPLMMRRGPRIRRAVTSVPKAIFVPVGFAASHARLTQSPRLAATGEPVSGGSFGRATTYRYWPWMPNSEPFHDRRTAIGLLGWDDGVTAPTATLEPNRSRCCTRSVGRSGRQPGASQRAPGTRRCPGNAGRRSPRWPRPRSTPEAWRGSARRTPFIPVD